MPLASLHCCSPSARALAVVALLAGCRPVVLEADPCAEDQRAVGVALAEPFFAPPPALVGLLPDSESPAVATDGTGFLVAWNTGGSVVAVRLSATGEVLDTPPRMLGPDLYGSRPCLVFDGAEYLVVWNRSAEGVWGARVSREGQVLDPGGVRLLGDTQVSALALAAAGGHTVFAWVEQRGTVVRVASMTGLSPGPAVEAAFPRMRSVSSLALAFDATTWALAVDGVGETANLSSLHFFEWAPFAALADFDLPRPGAGIALAAGNGKFLAAWGGDIILATLATPAGLEGPLLTLTPQGRRHRDPAVSFDGITFQVAWQGWPAGASGQHLLSTSVSPSGVVSVPDGARVDAHEEAGPLYSQWLARVTLASLGGRTLAVYGTRLLGERRMTAAFLAPDAGGVPLPAPLSLTPEFRNHPRVVATSSGYVVLWTENTQGGLLVGGARLGPGGEFHSLLDTWGPAEMGRGSGYAYDWLLAATAVGDQVLAVVGNRFVGPRRLGVLEPGQSQFAQPPEFTFPDALNFDVASSGTVALASWVELFGQRRLWARPLSQLVDGQSDAGAFLLEGLSSIDSMALGARDGGFGVVCLAEGRLHFLTLDLEGRLLDQSQLEGPGFGPGPMLRLERQGVAVALFHASDGGVRLLGAASEHGTPTFPVELGENQLSSRLAQAALGNENLLGWVDSTDAGLVPRGARLTAELGAVGGRPFAWALDAPVSDLDLAARSATAGVIAYAVNDAVRSTIAWRHFTVVDAGACTKGAATPPSFKEGRGCSTAGEAPSGLWLALFLGLVRRAATRR